MGANPIVNVGSNGEYTDENGDKHYPYKIDNLYYNAKAPDLPYTIVIQPGESRSIDLDGVYMAFGFTEVNGIYNSDVKDYDKYAFRPQHIIVFIPIYNKFNGNKFLILTVILRVLLHSNSGLIVVIYSILNWIRKRLMLQEFG